jgi:uncharacterized protein (TIGR03086 family)
MAMDAVGMCQQTTDKAAELMGTLQPADLERSTPCEAWNVRALINHMIGVNMRFTAGVTGEGSLPGPEVDLVGDDAGGSYRRAANAMMAAWRQPGTLEKTLKLPAGEMPGAAAAGVFAVDQIQHVWDLAKATGRPYPLDPSLAATALELSRPRIGPDRRGPGKPFAEEVACPDSAPAQDRLAAFLGRQP